MRLKEITSVIDGDFYLASRATGAKRDGEGALIKYNAGEIRTGNEELPQEWANKPFVIFPYDWATLLVEVLL